MKTTTDLIKLQQKNAPLRLKKVGNQIGSLQTEELCAYMTIGYKTTYHQGGYDYGTEIVLFCRP